MSMWANLNLDNMVEHFTVRSSANMEKRMNGLLANLGS